MKRDYAAAYGLIEEIATDLQVTPGNYVDLMYNLYLDDPMLVGGPNQRFATGILVDHHGSSPSDQLSYKETLLQSNAGIIAAAAAAARAMEAAATGKPKKQDATTTTPQEHFRRQPWEVVSLPSVDAAVVQFPYTNGFVSLLITSYRVSPMYLYTDTCVYVYISARVTIKVRIVFVCFDMFIVLTHSLTLSLSLSLSYHGR